MDALDELVDKITAESSKSKDDIFKLIREKQDELSGLVSKEGAAYIVGRELGVSLIKDSRPLHKISNISSGIYSVDVRGRILNLSDVREFDKNGRQGKVQNMTIGDETGTMRMTLWNQETELVQRLGLKEGMAVEVRGGYTKQDYQGNAELRIGKGVFKVADDKGLPKDVGAAGGQSPSRTSGNAGRFSGQVRRRKLSELKEGDMAEVRAMLIQLFQRKPFYEVCPSCGARATEQDSKWMCKEHGPVEPAYTALASGFIDDGDGNMRVVMFRDLAERILGKDAKELKMELDVKKTPEALFENIWSIGNEFIFRGRVSKNSMTSSLELMANEVEPIDVKREIESLLN